MKFYQLQMRKLRVGVWIGNEGYNPHAGGAFGYRSQLIEKLKEKKISDVEIVFLSNRKVDTDLKYYHVQWRYNGSKKNRDRFRKLFIELPLFTKVGKWLQSLEREDQKELFKELKSVVDIIYYPTPECVYPDFPFIYTYWDIGHLSTYTFPEMVAEGEFENRQKLYGVLHKAFMIFAESEAGKEELQYYLRINPDRIHVVPIFPSGIIDAKFKSSKPKAFPDQFNFIHYPAQFWSHKNHYNLILAFKKVKEKFPDLKLVFTGSDKGNKAYIKNLILELQIQDSIIDLGFVEMEELKWLYENSKGLVMPSFLGPTNMPLLEAAELGCPVACSNLKGHMEQLGEYGYYFNPENPSDISDVIVRMMRDSENNSPKTYNSTFNINNAIHSIEKAFQKINNIRSTWD